MKLPADKIANKVKIPTLAGMGFTIILSIIANSPLKDNPWFAITNDQAFVSLVANFIALFFGFFTEENLEIYSVNNPPGGSNDE